MAVMDVFSNLLPFNFSPVLPTYGSIEGLVYQFWLSSNCSIYRGSVKLGRGIPPDLRSGTSCLRSSTYNNRSCTSQLTSGPFLLGSTTLHICSSIFLCMMLCKNVVVHGHFVICILSMLGVDKCCKCQTLFKCHKWCLECLKTHGRQSGTLPLLSVLRARASALQASRLQGSTTSCWVL